MSYSEPIASIRYRSACLVATLAIAVIWPAVALAQTVSSVLTYPKNLAANVDLLQPIQWTSVANAQAYYLYVGSTLGAKDLVNTGETLNTSFPALNLPPNQTIYARLWTRVNNAWTYVDSTFVAAPVVKSTVTYPANGAIDADLTRPIQWTSVANAQAYYLYVGTTVGAKDLVNTGETLKTSYLSANLPHSVTLYARMNTKVGGVWRYIDSTFTVAPRARITWPADGASNVNLSQPIQWTSVAGVQAYYLYVGSTPGGKDLVNSGETLQTSYLATNLPGGRTVYARLWTKANNVWRYADTTFTTATPPPAISTLVFPADHAVEVDQTQPFRWTAIDNAQTYYLYIGSTPGAKDVVDSYETTSTSLLISSRRGVPLPTHVTLYARLFTRVAGAWRYRDSTFTASPMAPEFVYPVDGAVGVDVTLPFRFTPPAAATSYELRIGTSPGKYNLFVSGTLLTPSVTVRGLPSSGTLYARAFSKTGVTTMYTDIAFTLAASVQPATITTPANGAIGFDTAQAFQWTPIPLARGYRLTIGTALGTNDLHDSGEIQVTRRFVPNLPSGPLFGRVQTKIDAAWYSTDFNFSVGANTISAASQIDTAFWATDFVRSMAGDDNRPYSWTELAQRKFRAYCSDYAIILLKVWTEINGQFAASRLDVTLNPNGVDAHTLVELLNPETQARMLLDPTFDLTAKRTADGSYATAEDVSAATHNQQWTDISYVFLGPLNDHYGKTYIMDYPLLYNDIYHSGQHWTNGQGAPVLPYMNELTMPVSGTRQAVAIGCGTDKTAVLSIDGVEQVIDCSGVDGLSHIFYASTLVPTAQTRETVKVYRPQRNVF
jgi:hypothetical protein